MISQFQQSLVRQTAQQRGHVGEDFLARRRIGLHQVVDDLAKTYAAPRERVLADVSALLRSLADKKLLEL